MFKPNLKKFSIAILLSSLLASCGFFINLDKKYNSQTHDIDKEHFSIVFSHSIMGETHPCGCRHFPLGGLPQVAGLLHELKEKKEVFLVDTGDSLFPSNIVPKHIKDSLTKAAMNLAIGLDKLGLQYMLPGDYDLALGWSFLKEVKKNVKFQFLISNLKDPKIISHKRHVVLNYGRKKIFMIGLVDPATFQNKLRDDFIAPDAAMKQILLDLKSLGYAKENKEHMLVVLSHAGMEADRVFAEKFPMVDWIIGSHSQSFTNQSIDIGKTRIVQVLSKNHYVGEVLISSKEKLKEPFKYHEIREELEQKLSPNPFRAYIDNHKKEIEAIREKEQQKFSSFQTTKEKLKPAVSCLECHGDQFKDWQKTPHALAYGTLHIAKEPYNTECISCHSVGLNSEVGFMSAKDIVNMKDEKQKEKYWQEFKGAFKNVKSVRKLSTKKVMRIAQGLQKLDEKYKVTHNFSAVQCLNCHDMKQDHPFAVGETEGIDRKKEIRNKCLSCHTGQQSPEWYVKDSRGVPTRRVNEKVFKDKFKKMSH